MLRIEPIWLATCPVKLQPGAVREHAAPAASHNFASQAKIARRFHIPTLVDDQHGGDRELVNNVVGRQVILKAIGSYTRALSARTEPTCARSLRG
jgi:hypothetical protein